ncbi:MAG: beta-propeller fold lactonase family protein [Chloroflexi bacterium]|nr:beta-propeller fold lactonase family protein [Chloroflexota bacterium]
MFSLAFCSTRRAQSLPLNGLLCLLLVCASLLLPSLARPVQAVGGIVVTTTSLADDANDGACSLYEALEAAFLQQTNGLAVQPYHECTANAGPTTITFGGNATGGTIKITPDRYPLPMINKEVLIIGPVTISGSGAPAQLPDDKAYDSRLFWLADGGNLTLTALTLKDGYSSGYGGAIFSQNSNTTINLTQVAMVDNQAQGNGGAIATAGALNILQSTFSGNKALGITKDGTDEPGKGYGGAIAISGSDKLKVSLTNFSGNIASKGGGALVNQGATLELSDTAFNGNIAYAIGDSQGGGAIFNGSNSAFSMVRTIFNGNLTPKGSGGAIYNNLSAATTIISDTLFNGNISGDLATKGQGGAIYTEEDMNITRSTFNANIATKDGLGGAILNNKAALLKVTNTTFFANLTVDGKGGALANIDNPYPVSSDSMIELRNVTLSSNSAQIGGAIYNEEAVALWNTIVEQGAIGVGENCAGLKPVTDNGHNLQNPGASCGATIQTIDPKLDLPKPGPNFPNLLTMSPKDESPAVDAGDNAVCEAVPVNKEDQTGSERPKDSNNDGLAICDIGAVETGRGLPGFGADPAQPGPIDFGNALINTSIDAGFSVFETGKLPLAVQSVALDGPNAADFQILTSFPMIIPNGAPAQNVTLRCTPSAEGLRTASLTLVTDDPFHLKVDYDLICHGTVAQTPGFSSTPLKPGPLDFGSGIINTPMDQSLKIYEIGNTSLHVNFQAINGLNPGDFQVMSGLPAVVTDGNAAGAIVTVRCTPAALGIRTATLNLTTDDPNNPAVSFDLTCAGSPIPTPFLSAPGVSVNSLDGAYGVTVSPDSRQVYVTSYYAGSVSYFNRDLVNGQLTLVNTYASNEVKGARKVVVSPDGKQVYVTASSANSFVIYDRDKNSGQLTLKDAYTNNAIVKGLTGAHGVAVSPDGKNIYVASVDEDALVTFSRDNDDFVGFEDVITSIPDLNGAHGVTVSPDGKNVYVVSYTSNMSGTLATYSRNATDGSLTHVQTWREGQLITLFPQPRFMDGLAGAHAVTVSGDGNYLYVAGLHDNSLVVFKRNLLTGALGYLKTYKDGVANFDGLGGTTGVVISPDGNHLFTTALNDQALGVFDRDPTTGLVDFVEAFHRDANTGLPALNGANEVVVSPDGSTVYAVSGIDDAVVAFAVANPKATIDTLLPASVPQGANNFTLVIKGKNFVGGSQVQWNGSARPTTFVSPGELHAEIAAADVGAAGVAPIKVINPAPGGGDSNNQVAFTISAPGDNPLPSIDFINPQSVPSDVQQFTLSVHGANFVPGATVRMNGADRPTQFVSPSELQATIGAADVAVAAALLADDNEVNAASVDANQPAGITVFNPTPGGGSSNAVLFTVLEAGQNPAPSLTQLQPAMLVTQGAAATSFVVKITGANFIEGAQAAWNGAPRATKFINDQALEVTLTAGDVGVVGSGGLSVVNPAPGGGSSNVLNFTVVAPAQNPAPALTQIAPANTLAHGAVSVPVVVTVVGSNFMPGSQVYWNGVLRPSKFIDSTQLEVTLLATDVAADGTGALSVLNPPPGGGVSDPQMFTIFGYGIYLPLVQG